MIIIFKDINILIKFIIIIYVGVSSLIGGDPPRIVVPILLIIISLSILAYVVPKKYKSIIIAVVFTISMMLSINFFDGAILLAFYSVNELLSIHKEMSYINFIVVPFTILFIYKDEKWIEYFLIIVIASVLQYYISKLNNRVKFLENQSDENRKKISSLTHKLREIEKFKEQEFTTLKLQERNDLSGKMHDKIGHTLAGALLQLEALKIILGNESSDASNILDNTTTVLRKGMNDIRMTLREIKPPIEELGLNNIKLLLEEKIKNTQFSYSVISEGNVESISPNQWRIITEGIRELSTNSIKYSKGKKIDIYINVLNKLIKTEIIDDGIGSSRITKGMGLINLEERILNENGKLILDGSIGFSAIILLPVKGE